MLNKSHEELYKNDQALINRDVKELELLIQSTGWKLVDESIGFLIEQYRDNLETAPDTQTKEIQYAIQNLREIRNTPEKLKSHILTLQISSDSPPKEMIGFDYQN